jgi:glycosyltransferase 2 family protein
LNTPIAGRPTAAVDGAKHGLRTRSSAKTGAWRRFWTPERRRRLAPWIALAFLGLVAWLIADHVREIEWTEVRAALVAYPLATLAVAAALVVASHFTYACYDLLGRLYVGHKLSTPAVLGTAFISYAFNLNLGSLVGGFGFRIRLYSKLGLDAADIGRVIAFSLVTNWSGWLLLAGASFAARQVRLPESFPIGVAALQAIGCVMIAVPLAYVAACFWSRRRTWRWRTHEFVLPAGTLALAQLALSSFNWSLIGAIVWVLLPAGLGYGSVLVTLLSAAIVGAATHVPGGLGVLEAVFVTALGGSVAAPALVAALLAYRALYYLAPLVVAAAMHFTIEAKTRRRRRA